MSYWRLFYHVVWATKDRQPMVQEAFAPSLYNCISAKARQLGGLVHAVGGTEDHVHVAVTIPPTIALYEFIRQLKGVSSHFMNHEFQLPQRFAWQAEYGVLTLDSKQMGGIVQYIEDQQQHHSGNTTVGVLERIVGEGQGYTGAGGAGHRIAEEM